MPACDLCKEWFYTVYFFKDKWICSGCRTKEGYKEELGIFDATGKRRDRVWLQNKLDFTRTDKRWEKDIKSRRITQNGKVIRTDKK